MVVKIFGKMDMTAIDVISLSLKRKTVEKAGPRKEEVAIVKGNTLKDI